MSIEALGARYGAWLHPRNDFIGTSRIEAEDALKAFRSTAADLSALRPTWPAEDSLNGLVTALQAKLTLLRSIILTTVIVYDDVTEQYVDERLRGELLLVGFGMGEWFARRRGLKWAVSIPDTQHENLPCITGFSSRQELPVFVVTDTLLRVFVDSLERGDSRTQLAMQTWYDRIP